MVKNSCKDIITMNGWLPYLNSPALFSLSVNKGKIAANIINPGNSLESCKVFQNDFLLVFGKRYKLTFEAYSSKKRNIKVVIKKSKDSQTKYLEKELSINSKKLAFSFIFDFVNETSNMAEIVFQIGKVTDDFSCESHEIYLENISIFESS